MNRITRSLRRLFCREPKLRNKPGGMAWIKFYGPDFGAHVMAGHAVKTLRIIDGNLWVIDPPQPYVVGPNGVRSPNGSVAYPGDRVIAIAIADECLEPWKEDGITSEDVRELYAPDELVFVTAGESAHG